MFDWKIILSIIIVLALVMGYLGSNPVVSGFFNAVGEKFSFLTLSNPQRSVEFSLTADKYSNLDFSVKKSVNFTITGSTVATLKTGILRTNKSLSIYGFTGSGSLRGSELMLNGKIAKVELPEITVAVQETITLNSTFTSLSAEDLSTSDLTIKDTSGTLVARGASTQFKGDITVVAPVGNFDFYKNNLTFAFSGKANKITIPSAGISIG